MAEARPRQFVAYTFYKVLPEWRRLDEETKRRGREEFSAVVDEYSASIFCRSYSLLGTRADCDFMLWKAAVELEIFNRFEGELNRSGLGAYITRPYSYLAGLRRSMYLPETSGGDRHGTGAVRAAGHRYLFVYPFVKKRPWYKLSKQARQGMMNEHFEIGNRYPDFEVNTGYSFGVDDQEFVVAFEGDDPHRFIDLVMELRESEASAFTERDTPTFACLRADLKETLELVG
jgi:chlorite dismutase